MPKRVKTFKSINLLGETRKEEKERLLNERIKMLLEGKSPQQVRDAQIRFGGKGYLKGTTSYQRKRRRKILEEY